MCFCVNAAACGSGKCKPWKVTTPDRQLRALKSLEGLAQDALGVVLADLLASHGYLALQCIANHLRTFIPSPTPPMCTDGNMLMAAKRARHLFAYHTRGAALAASGRPLFGSGCQAQQQQQQHADALVL